MLDVVIRGGTIVDGTGEPGGPGWLDEIFAGAPDDVRRRILRDNLCAYWGLDREAELTATPT